MVFETVGQGTGYDAVEAERDIEFMALMDQKEATELENDCTDQTAFGKAAEDGQSATEAAAALLAQSCPSLAKSRRLMELDDAHGPPTVGTE